MIDVESGVSGINVAVAPKTATALEHVLTANIASSVLPVDAAQSRLSRTVSSTLALGMFFAPLAHALRVRAFAECIHALVKSCEFNATLVRLHPLRSALSVVFSSKRSTAGTARHVAAIRLAFIAAEPCINAFVHRLTSPALSHDNHSRVGIYNIHALGIL